MAESHLRHLPSRSLCLSGFTRHTVCGARSDSMHFVSAFTTPSCSNSNGARQKREKNGSWQRTRRIVGRSGTVSRFQIRSLALCATVPRFCFLFAATVLTFFQRSASLLSFFRLSLSFFSFLCVCVCVRHRRHAMRILLNQPERRYRRVARKSSSPKNRERQVDWKVDKGALIVRVGANDEVTRISSHSLVIPYLSGWSRYGDRQRSNNTAIVALQFLVGVDETHTPMRGKESKRDGKICWLAYVRESRRVTRNYAGLLFPRYVQSRGEFRFSSLRES